MIKKLFLLFSLFSFLNLSAQDLQLALLKYNGGGDWYANPTALPNLAQFTNKSLGTAIRAEYATVELASTDIFNYPFLHMTGHGNVVFNAQEIENLRQYLMAGGFLHIDDNYGMDPFIRKELEKLFPNRELEPLPANHPIFNCFFKLKGLPKIHLHDEKPPEAWCIQIEGRIALLYTHESDIGDGWEDPEVHNDPQGLREQALQMGANILFYVFEGSF